jgi:hypothetical protein
MDDPEQFAAWAFAAGIPDPRSKKAPGKFPHQPMVNPACFPALSQMLWDLGFRHHADKQTKWVKPARGTHSNFQCWDMVDVKPLAEQMLVEEFPEMAKKLARVTPENHKDMVKEQGEMVQELLRTLQEATAQVQGATEYNHGLSE